MPASRQMRRWKAISRPFHFRNHSQPQRFARLSRLASVSAVLSMVLILGPSAAARADVIYAYTGNNFTSAQAPYTTSDSVTATMILLSPLLPNESNTDQGSNVAELIVSDGVQTLDSLNGLQGNFEAVFSTDSSANITNWIVVIDNNQQDVIQTQDDPFSGTFDKGTNVVNGVTAIGSNSASPGVWSIVQSLAP
jgi:hypothetical protein